MILLDTNVVSEAFRPQPINIVREWFDAQEPEDLYLCTPVLAELRYGVEQLPAGARRARLDELITHIEEVVFVDRILPVDRRTAHEFGRIVARRKLAGRPLMTMDAFIAAIAISNRAVVATRDTHDFEGVGLELVDPFTSNAR
jgi:toxin FitB